MIVWKNDSDTIILKPIEIRSKRGVKKMKKTNSAIYIPNMDAKEFEKICVEKGLQFIYTQVQPHGRLIDGDSKTFPTLHRNPSNDYMKGWNACLRSVQQQPVIIPEDGGET